MVTFKCNLNHMFARPFMAGMQFNVIAAPVEAGWASFACGGRKRLVLVPSLTGPGAKCRLIACKTLIEFHQSLRREEATHG